MKVNMKKILKFTLHVLFILLLTSCTAFFDASTYYSSRRRHRNISDEDIRLPEDEETTPLAPTNEEAIQKLFDDAEKNKDSIFSASNFNGWIFYMTDLAGDNVGTYKFSSGTWQTDGNGESHTQKGTTVGSGFKTLSNVKYYRYKSRKARWKDVNYTNFVPLEGADEKMKKREERFLFFRFTANSKGPDIDSAMLCVDTYTKFCWYYAEPSWLDSILGNKVPKDWVDFESPVLPTNGEQEHTRSYGKFYYYDPVGYVEASGDVVIYEWAKADLRRNYFNPRQNYLETAERSSDKPGKSPYYITSGKGKENEPPPKVEIPEHKESLLVQISYLKNIDFSVIEQMSFAEQSYAYLSATAKGLLGGTKKGETKLTKKVPLEEFVNGGKESCFQIPLLELKNEKNFTIKTYSMFANKLKAGDANGVYIGIAPEDYGLLSFIYEERTEGESLVFNGMNNGEYKDTRKQNEVKIECSLKTGDKIKAGENKTFEVTYKIKGYFYNDPWFVIKAIEGREIKNEVSFKVGYTLSLSK